MSRHILFLYIFFAILQVSPFLLAEEGESKPESNRDLKPESNEASENKKKDLTEIDILPRFDQIFNNPFLNQTLNAGAQVANNAFDSLLEGVFYQLMDQRFTAKLVGDLSFRTELSRSVFTTAQGKYVITERINLGPEFKKPLPKVFNQIPFELNANVGLDFLSIYLRSDPQRVIEAETLPTWRVWANNWLGILTVLEKILPPAFDPNQMYDPIREVTSPLSFPLDVQDFSKMEVGSIQSYAFQGSVALPLNFDGALSPYILDEIESIDLKITLPYTLFMEGEYRINVLKRSENIAWVGLSKLRRGGHSLAGFIGTTIFLFSKSLGPIPWQGVPAQLSPIDVSIVESLSDKYDHIYEFDLKKSSAVKAYQRAIAGDFTFAKDAIPEGVKFHFSQKALTKEVQRTNTKNLALIVRSESQQSNAQSEIKITDELGEFFVLENVSLHNDSTFNIFTGEKSVEFSNEVNLNVKKVKDENFQYEDPEYTYSFHESMKPYQIIFKLQIRDRFSNATDFNKYIDTIRTISKLPLAEVPKIPKLTERAKRNRRVKAFFESPDTSSYTTHTLNTRVGRFNGNVLVVLDSDIIRELLNRTQDELKKALYSSYEKDPNGDYSYVLEHLKSYLMYPLRIFHYKSLPVDAYREIQNASKAMEKIDDNSTPKEILSAFYKLFDTDYPFEIIETIYRLCDETKIPRSATLFISPTDDLEDDLKKQLSLLNEKTFTSDTPFPDLERYRLAKSKIDAFVPQQLKTDEVIPKIKDLKIENGRFLRIHLENPKRLKRFYVKIQSVGRFKLADDSLATELLEKLSPQKMREKIVYSIELFNLKDKDQGLVDPEEFEEDSEYLISVSASELEGSWSGAFSVKTIYEGGKLKIK